MHGLAHGCSVGILTPLYGLDAPMSSSWAQKVGAGVRKVVKLQIPMGKFLAKSCRALRPGSVFFLYGLAFQGSIAHALL